MEAPPKKQGDDKGYALVKALVGSTPIAGHAFAVAMETYFAPPLEKRREKWFERVAEAIGELQQQQPGLTLEHLAENEVFITAVVQASQIALRNHQAEKIELLKQAVLHSVLPNAPSEDKQLMFLRFIDELTPSHVRALAAARVRKNQRRSYLEIIWDDVPELQDGDPHQRFVVVLIRELQVRGLLHSESDYNFPNKPNAVGGAPQLADEFLSFVGIPPHKYSAT